MAGKGGRHTGEQSKRQPRRRRWRQILRLVKICRGADNKRPNQEENANLSIKEDDGADGGDKYQDL